eukprot:9551085-Alexandrium_andersonii.AAC.1
MSASLVGSEMCIRDSRKGVFFSLGLKDDPCAVHNCTGRRGASKGQRGNWSTSWISHVKNMPLHAAT